MLLPSKFAKVQKLGQFAMAKHDMKVSAGDEWGGPDEERKSGCERRGTPAGAGGLQCSFPACRARSPRTAANVRLSVIAVIGRPNLTDRPQSGAVVPFSAPNGGPRPLAAVWMSMLSQ